MRQADATPKRTFNFVLPSGAIVAVAGPPSVASLHVFANRTRTACGAAHSIVPGSAVYAVASLDTFAGIHRLARVAEAALGRSSGSVLSGSTSGTVGVTEGARS